MEENSAPWRILHYNDVRASRWLLKKHDKGVSYVVYPKVWSSTEKLGYGEGNQTEKRENREVIVFSKYMVKETLQ
jgi:hypothetical protein